MKQYDRYRMDFSGQAVRLSGIFMAVSMFLLTVYYLGIRNLQDIGGIAALILFWIPIILGVIYLVLLQMLRWNAPGIYAILGALFCLLLMFGLFTGDSVLRIVLGIPAYLICGAVLVLAAGGYLPGRLPAAICFGVVIAVRFLFFDLGHISGTDWVDEISSLCQLVSLMLLPMGMVKGKSKS